MLIQNPGRIHPYFQHQTLNIGSQGFLGWIEETHCRKTLIMVAYMIPNFNEIDTPSVRSGNTWYNISWTKYQNQNTNFNNDTIKQFVSCQYIRTAESFWHLNQNKKQDSFRIEVGRKFRTFTDNHKTRNICLVTAKLLDNSLTQFSQDILSY